MHITQTLFFMATACYGAMAADAWTDLFNGKDIEGWIQRGGSASYRVEDGCIVGTSTLETPNTFLCSGRDYGDFILEYEFKVDPKLNSGVQIRSRSVSSRTVVQWEGKKIEIKPDVVHGYQIEIDPEPKKDRWWSGGIFDESRRGWLYPGSLGGDGKAFGNEGRKIFKQGDWNKIRVEAKGDSIKTTLNGIPRADIKDAMTSSGFIALQVHGIGKDASKDGTEVRWRNLRIQEIPAPVQNTLNDADKKAGWRLLWDGKSSEGWRSARSLEFPKGGWEMNDGVLSITETGGAEAANAGDIITREKFSNFELSLDFKIVPGANSGIKIFVDPEINKGGGGSSIGPEFQLLDDLRHPDAKMGRDGNRTIGSLYDMITAPATKMVNPPGEWNNARILSDGMQVSYFLNGVKTVEFERGSKEWRDLVATSKYKVYPGFGELKEGHILLQDHGNRASFRNIKIRELSKE